MRRRGWSPAGVAGGVHPGQPAGLLRRQPRRRLQRPGIRVPVRRIRGLLRGEVSPGPEPVVPGRAAGPVRRRRRHSVQKRMHRVQQAGILLHRGVQQSTNMPADRLFPDFQECLSQSL